MRRRSLSSTGQDPRGHRGSQSNAFAAHITADELVDWRRVFEAHDRKHAGSVSKHDLGLLLRSIGLTFTSAELQEMTTMADADLDGTIDFEEFCGLMLFRKRRLQLEGQPLAASSSRVLRLLHQLRSGQESVVLEAPAPMPGGGEAAPTSTAAAATSERWELLSIVDELWTNRTVRRLDLSAAAGLLEDLQLSELCRVLAFSPALALAELCLSHSSLGDDGAKVVASALRHNVHLQLLELEHTSVGHVGIRTLLSALRNGNRTLKKLSLLGNPAVHDLTLMARLREQLRDNAARETLRQVHTCVRTYVHACMGREMLRQVPMSAPRLVLVPTLSLTPTPTPTSTPLNADASANRNPNSNPDPNPNPNPNRQVPLSAPRLVLSGQSLMPHHAPLLRDALVARLPKPPAAADKPSELAGVGGRDAPRLVKRPVSK